MEKRTIQVRGWDTRKGKWVDPMMILQLASTDENGVLMPITETVELTEFTGLKDKTGKKIFEGDILRAQLDTDFGSLVEKIGKVVYKTSNCLTCCGFYVELADMVLCAHNHEENVEVIGNVFENPDLLK